MTGIIITGVARGGTSLIAGICDGLGIPMGKHGPRFENPYLQWAVLAERWDVVDKLIRTIEADLPLWGWKLPEIHRHLPQVHHLISSPRFIFVLKDPVEVALRRADTSQQRQFAKLIKRNAKAMEMMADFAVKTNQPTLFISYDRALRDLSSCVSEVATFCGISCFNAEEVVEGIRENHKAYRDGVYRPRVRTALDSRLSRLCAQEGVYAPAKARSSL